MTPPITVVELAVDAATCSPCQSKRGAVIFRASLRSVGFITIISHGYNYKPRGFDCDGSDACKATCRREAIHAEQQALLIGGVQVVGADILHAKAVDKELAVSRGPSCGQCSKLILASGIKGVWLYLDTGWHRYEAADYHQQSLDAGR